jgi:hypothetical protein
LLFRSVVFSLSYFFQLAYNSVQFSRDPEAMTKFVQSRPYADPDVAARKIIEIANSFEPYMDNRLRDVRNTFVTLRLCPLTHGGTKMSEPDAFRFHMEAEECRHRERASNPDDKEAWLRLAADWTKLAQAAERRADSRKLKR